MHQDSVLCQSRFVNLDEVMSSVSHRDRRTLASKEISVATFDALRLSDSTGITADDERLLNIQSEMIKRLFAAYGMSDKNHAIFDDDMLKIFNRDIVSAAQNTTASNIGWLINCGWKAIGWSSIPTIDGFSATLIVVALGIAISIILSYLRQYVNDKHGTNVVDRSHLITLDCQKEEILNLVKEIGKNVAEKAMEAIKKWHAGEKSVDILQQLIQSVRTDAVDSILQTIKGMLKNVAIKVASVVQQVIERQNSEQIEIQHGEEEIKKRKRQIAEAEKQRQPVAGHRNQYGAEDMDGRRASRSSLPA